jgi:outer membrane protein OmpA-like peptidoglycan-associated protein
MLEVLDPEQNSTFRDHYLDLPFDLSHVFFICTANLLDPVPPALRDRMEVIELSGYTHEEKREIARRYLVPRQMERNGLGRSKIEITDDALDLIGRVATAVQPFGRSLRIEGHTDNVPIHNREFNSNWELSTARASTIIRFLIERVEFDPRRLSAAGYGEFHPRVANDSPENRAHNRRVDIVILEAAS